MKHSWVLLMILASMQLTSETSALAPHRTSPVRLATAEDDLACLSRIGTGGMVAGRVPGSTNEEWFAALILLDHHGAEIPAFCIDILTHTDMGVCYRPGPFSGCEVAYILQNFPPEPALTPVEVMARQAAIWTYSDQFEILGPPEVLARAQEILERIPAPCLLVQTPPSLTLTPAENDLSLPGGRDCTLVVMATVDGAPAQDQTVYLSSTFGRLHDTRVTTNALGQATVVLSSLLEGEAVVSATTAFALPSGTDMVSAGGHFQRIVVADTREYVYQAAAQVRWTCPLDERWTLSFCCREPVAGQEELELCVIRPPAGAVDTCQPYRPAPEDIQVRCHIDLAALAGQDCEQTAQAAADALEQCVQTRLGNLLQVNRPQVHTVATRGCFGYKFWLTGEELGLAPGEGLLLSTGCGANNLGNGIAGDERLPHVGGLCIQANPCQPDVNGDGIVDVVDLGIVNDLLGEAPEQYTGTGPGPDTNLDGVVDLRDLYCVSQLYGRRP